MGLESDIDLEALERLRRLGGEDLVSKMATLFVSHAESAIRDAAAGFAEADFDRVRRAAHSLKSSAGNLGARCVQDIAGQIEQLAEQTSGEVQPLLIALEAAYLKAKDRLALEIRERR